MLDTATTPCIAAIGAIVCQGAAMSTFSALASCDRAMTQPSLFERTTTGLPSSAGLKTRSHDT
nr:hypothetical protein [Frigoribacterium sp. NBH87]